MAFDPSDYCSNPKCGGTADACGCPHDHNTQDLMRCPDCGGQWWRSHGDTSTVCMHPGCGRDGSVVLRAASYAPSFDENGEPIAGAGDDEPDRMPCGESGCLCYGVGEEHADCACGCDCPDDEEWTPGTCDMCAGSTEEDLERAATQAFVPVCACAIGQGADYGDCQCGRHLFADDEQVEVST